MKNDANIMLSLDELFSLLELKKQATLVNDGAQVDAKDDDDSIKDFFGSLFSAVLKYWWIILLTTVVFAAVAFSVLTFKTPQYTATVQMYARNRSVTSSETELDIQDIANADYYINLYGEYLKMDMPLESILRKLNEKHEGKYSDLTIDGLHEMVRIGSLNKTTLMYVSVTDTDPQRAVDIVNIIREELPRQLKELSGLSEDPVKPIDWPEAAEDAEMIPLNRIRNTVIAAFVGFLIACIFVCIKGCLLDDTIESLAWLSENFKNIPILAEIPDIEQTVQRSSGADVEKKE